MKLSDYLMDFGRVVAYYPNLKKVTKSTTATILLCQLVYYHKRQISNLKSSEITPRELWVKKNNRELTWETGLTYEEQKTARKCLRDLGILEERRVHRQIGNYYRVNFDVLNDLWDIANSKPEELVPEDDEDEYEIKTGLSDTDKVYKSKLKSLEIIRDKIQTKLAVTADDDKWNKFIRFAYEREHKHNEKVEIFLDWAVKEGFNPIYWTPEKLKTLYPRAFMNTKTTTDKAKQPDNSFVAPLPKDEKKDVAPMPQDLKVQRELF